VCGGFMLNLKKVNYLELILKVVAVVLSSVCVAGLLHDSDGLFSSYSIGELSVVIMACVVLWRLSLKVKHALNKNKAKKAFI
tara:strand:- start:272 stop:517 length:246 start_codon:yes stop_codon:yes gene_type:complete